MKLISLMLPLAWAGAAQGQDVLKPLTPPQAAEGEQPVVGAEAAGTIQLEGLTVTAAAAAEPELPASFSMQSVSYVTQETLRRNAQASLGETLGWEAGVASNYCSPGASRPVVRGFEGVRVRMLRDGLGTFDLSDLSPDHGVALEPLLLEGVEIHRGPASLLYGNAAIGGAINARTRTLARQRPERPISGAVEMFAETQGHGIGSAGYFTWAEDSLVFRLTGSARDANDISIPGFARSGAYEAMFQPRVFDPATSSQRPILNPHGTLPNSYHRSQHSSIGVSWLPKSHDAMLGASFSHAESAYGVPYFFPGDATDLFGRSSIELSQSRLDLEGRVALPAGIFSSAEVRLGLGEYLHDEPFTGLEKDAGRDFIETAFDKDEQEMRVDLQQRDALQGQLTGRWGVTAGADQLHTRRALTPPPSVWWVDSQLESQAIGLYTLQKLQRGDWTFQCGGRWEASQVEDLSYADFGFTQGVEDDAASASSSLTWQREGVLRLDRLSLTGLLSQVRRLPTVNERYAFWNSAGIGRFLVGGDLDGTPLGTEESLGWELGIEAALEPVTWRFNFYQYDFERFIFLQEVPSLTGGFGKAAQFIEREALFQGFETQVDWQIQPELTLSLMADTVRATNVTDREPIPRMPPLRFGARLEWKRDHFTAGMEIRHATEQDRIKPPPRPELPTAAFTMVNADVSWQTEVLSHDLTLFVRLTNLLDDEARLATSFRKDVAPLPGRALLVGTRLEF